MPRYAPDKMPPEVKRRYFELIRSGRSGLQASQRVGVSLSCGSLWFIDAGRVAFTDAPISPRFLSQDDRIEIADGLMRGEPVKAIVARIGKSYQTVYREIARISKPDGRYRAVGMRTGRRICGAGARGHGRLQSDTRPGPGRCRAAGAATVSRADKPVAAAPLSAQAGLACVCRDDLRRRLPEPRSSRPRHDAPRTARTYRHRRGRGRTRDGALRQSTAMKPIRLRPAIFEPPPPGRALGR